MDKQQAKQPSKPWHEMTFEESIEEAYRLYPDAGSRIASIVDREIQEKKKGGQGDR